MIVNDNELHLFVSIKTFIEEESYGLALDAIKSLLPLIKLPTESPAIPQQPHGEICALEFGYRACEKGLNLQGAISDFIDIKNGRKLRHVSTLAATPDNSAARKGKHGF